MKIYGDEKNTCVLRMILFIESFANVKPLQFQDLNQSVWVIKRNEKADKVL